MTRLIGYLFAVSVTASLAAQHTPHHAPPVAIPEPPPLTAELKEETFAVVQQVVRDQYFDRTFAGVDWNAVTGRYRARALAAADHVAFHGVLNQMVKELPGSHLAVVPPRTPGSPFGARLVSVGVELQHGGARALVAKVEAGSAAAKAGLSAGDEILAVDGVPVHRIAAEYVAAGRAEARALRHDQLWLAVHEKLRGEPDRPVTLTLRNGNAQREVRLQRALSTTHGAPAPSGFVMRDGIGVLTISTFHGKIDALLERAFTECRTCPAMIVDLRDNNGGFVENIAKLLDRVMPAGGTFGSTSSAKGRVPLTFAGSGERAFAGALVVLLNGGSASSSEVFAAAIQDLRRGRVIGSRSGGAVIAADIRKLPTGGELLYPIMDVQRQAGEPLEGVGVVPDIAVAPTADDLRLQRDVVMELALWIARPTARGD